MSYNIKYVVWMQVKLLVGIEQGDQYQMMFGGVLSPDWIDFIFSVSPSRSCSASRERETEQQERLGAVAANHAWEAITVSHARDNSAPARWASASVPSQPAAASHNRAHVGSASEPPPSAVSASTAPPELGTEGSFVSSRSSASVGYWGGRRRGRRGAAPELGTDGSAAGVCRGRRGAPRELTGDGGERRQSWGRRAAAPDRQRHSGRRDAEGRRDGGMRSGGAMEICGGSHGRRRPERWRPATEAARRRGGMREREGSMWEGSENDSAQYGARWLGIGEGCSQLAECRLGIQLSFQFQFREHPNVWHSVQSIPIPNSRLQCLHPNGALYLLAKWLVGCFAFF